jgi:N-acetylmuramoyl-L-alanine amidase
MNREEQKEERWERLIRTVLLALMLVSVHFIIQGGAHLAASQSVADKKPGRQPCVVLDAGHGGADPGKVGVDGSLEKDINLKIVEKLQTFLELEDVQVYLTRESDAGLYDENASNKKVQDMKNRVALIEEAQPDLVVSIHQNSYHEESIHGAQTFYFAGSEKSKALAERIQQSMTLRLDPENTRQAKANDSYYLLKKTSYPIVIVECGFLSNNEEAQKLSTEEYQEKVAWAVHLGVLQYLSGQS